MSHVPAPKRHPYDQWSPDARALDLIGDKWTLLIVRDLMSGPRRFVELQRVLPGISTEQLRSRLNRMVADGMLTRKRYREVPPRVDYELTERAKELAPILGELARWGYEWAWGPPRPAEAIDIGAIFRLIPGLIGERWTTSTGNVELIVSDAREGGEPASYMVSVGHSGAQLVESPVVRAGTRIRGTVDGWIAALSPIGERSGLRITGDRGLAGALLEAMAPAERRHEAEAESDSAAAF